MKDDVFFYCRLPVFGQLGPRTKMNTRVHPPVVESLECLIDVAPDSDIFEIFPCILSTTGLCEVLTLAGCSGYTAKRAVFKLSDAYRESHGKVPLPELWWLHVRGTPKEHDFGVQEGTKLIVSSKAKTIIESKKHQGVTFSSAANIPADAEITKQIFDEAAKLVAELRKNRRWE